MIPLMQNAFLNEHETKKAPAEFILKADASAWTPNASSSNASSQLIILFNSGGSANLSMLQAPENLGRKGWCLWP